MTVRVSTDDLLLAADWLDFYDQEAPEFAQIKRAADWLRDQTNKRDKEASIRALAREHETTPAVIRRALKAAEAAQ